jgi:hypothetical protein
MDAGQYDNSHGMDLLLSNNASNTLWILKDLNAGTTGAPVFGVAESDKIVLTTYSTVTGTQNTLSTPAFADVDNDGDLDVLTTVRSTASLFLSWNQSGDEEKLRPTFIGSPDHSGISRPWLTRNGSALTLGAIVDLPVGAPNVNDLYLQVAVFQKAAPPQSTVTDRIGQQVALIDWDTISTQATVDVDCGLHSPVYSYVPPYSTPSDEVRFENLYIVMVRLVALNSSGGIRYAYPADFHGVEAAIGDGNMNYFLSLTEDDPCMVRYSPCTGCSTGDEVGTMTPLPTMPTPAEGPIVIQ